MKIFILIILCSSYTVANTQINKAIDSLNIYYNDCNFTLPAKFPGGLKTWAQYLRNNTNSELGKKYIVVDKNKQFVKETVNVIFRISKWGFVDTAFVIQDGIKVHPKLLVEAIRVIKASPRWIAARLNNKKVDYYNRQALTWQVDKE